jgi:hypothetical protein
MRSRDAGRTLRSILLICGAFASLLYVAIDLLAAARYGDYHSFTSQGISELMARGAPTERLVDPLFLLYDLLMIAFGVGVWRSAGQERRLRLGGGVLVAYAGLGLLGPTLFEVSPRGSSDVQRDVLHIALTAVMVLLMMLSVGLAAFAQGRRFRLYSLATIVISLGAGALTGFAARHLATGEPTPWLGVTERISIGAYLAWVVVLAFSLLRSEPGAPVHTAGRYA